MWKDYQGAFWVWLAVVVAILGLRGAGALQPIELAVYDRLLGRLERPATVSSRVALIEISEQDIQSLGHWPLSDLEVVTLIESLMDAGAESVGLDIYRDLPVPPGVERFERHLEEEPRSVFVFKHGDPGSGGIPGRATLHGSGRLGFSDLLLDPDGRVRRGLLFLDRPDGGSDYAFPLRLALAELARQGIHPQPDPVHEEWLRLGTTSIPYFEAGGGGYAKIDDQGYQVLLDYHQSSGDFEAVAFADALGRKLRPGSLSGRIVLVGASAESLNDFALLPDGVRRGGSKEQAVTGVWVHASFLDQILRYGYGESRPLRFVAEGVEILTILGAALMGCLFAIWAGGFTSSSTLLLAVGAAVGVVVAAGSGFAFLSRGIWIPVVAPTLAGLVAAVAHTAWQAGRNRAQRAELMQVFSQVQSPRVANELWRRRDEYLVGGRLEPEAATVTVLFLDMKGYTASAEKMQPAVLMSWINEFMAPMAQLIEDHGGYPDDYFGDGIKADFGVPVLSTTDEEIAETAKAAIRCANAMVAELTRINARYEAAGLPTVALRIGIHTGHVVVGLLGSRNKGKYTVVGDAVVTAQRLESTDQVPHDFDVQPCRVLLSEQTYALVAGRNQDTGGLDPGNGQESYTSMGNIALKGKKNDIGVYRMNPAGP
jgi:adenylate cyclase